MAGNDELNGLVQSTFTHDGTTRDVHTVGRGPAVIVMHEIPGLTPSVIAFGQRVAERGMSAVMPVLFGEAGREPSGSYMLRQLSWACIAREFTSFASRSTAPVTDWLRELARHAHHEHGGPGVGAVGMCFTGGYALGMMVDDTTVAPVLSQPSAPFPITKKHKRDLGVSDADLARVKERAAGGACVLGLRFTEDTFVPEARFDRLRGELGERFIAVEIDSSADNPHGIKRSAHSVLTEDLVDEVGHPTRDALEQVLTFFAERLTDSESSP